MLEALKQADKHSIVLMHACCHNPTGVDLTKEQWQALVPVLRERELIALPGFGLSGLWRWLERRCLRDSFSFASRFVSRWRIRSLET